MSKAPAMPMYWDAYLADTTHLTTEEHGAYMLLLAAMWRRNGSVPDDDKDNARILGLTVGKWRKIKARFAATISGFQVEDDEITQEKLQKTWEITQEKIDKNRTNGAKGGRPKSNKNKGIEKADGSISVNPNESIPDPDPEPKEEDKSSSSQEAENYQRYLKAHPSGGDADLVDELFSGLVADGEDPESIIAAATAYAETVKDWSSEGKVQRADNFLDPDRGKWREYVPKPKAAVPDKQTKMNHWAKHVREGRAFGLERQMAEDCLAAGLFTQEQLTAARGYNG